MRQLRDPWERVIHAQAKRKCWRVSDRMAKKSELKAVLEQQDYRCGYTGIPLTPANCSLDHRVPLSDKGKCEPGNWVWCLAEVNHMKGSLSYDRFVELCRAVVEHGGG